MRLSCFYLLCLSSVLWTFTIADPIDLGRFSHLLSNHFLYEHFDKAYLQLAKEVSLQFRNSIQINVKQQIDRNTTTSPVDINVLTRQLKGAIGSFIEDKLLTILTRHDTVQVQQQLDHLIYSHCARSIDKNILISPACLLERPDAFLDKLQRYINQHVKNVLTGLNDHDLPKLFEKTGKQLSEILAHFNRNTMNPLYQQLEWHHKYYNRDLWITNDMVQDFILNINHVEEEENSIQRLLYLSN
ncbi:hypothetical protein BY458DRAFT_542790 [Sporodiniella umbellata]|nr:hypothetical protein BY458DRAFT_542790 [Sporodiniella umbellata]